MGEELPKSKEEARASGSTRYMGSPCKRGHDGARHVSNGQCVECAAEADHRRGANARAAKAKRSAERKAAIAAAIAAGIRTVGE